ncbi:MAG: hypothetical protein HYZ37_02850 [Candidatus Solibacter usitatus]|nr:hypothetical protein [Candidatus Solibacter usitatus]
MTMRKFVLALLCLGLLALICAPAVAANLTTSLKPGTAEIKSASSLAFGPDGVLFVADHKEASVFALDTGDTKAGKPAADVQGINEKIAAFLGTAADQILINDMAVNPASKKVYFSVSRGKGPDAAVVILRVDGAGKIEELSLAGIKHSKASLPNAPADVKNSRGQSPRQEAITDMAYIDGRVIVAGLSNEEFASNLRVIPFPFQAVDKGTAIEIFHGAHGRFETNAPVRTFVAYSINNQPHVLAAYTCTPLVKFPLTDLKPGKKVMGTTIAELGNRNRPLDMITYKKDGVNYFLLNNSSRGVMKLNAEKLDKYEGITKQTDVTGVPYETIASMKGVEHLDKIDNERGLMLVRGEGGSLNLQQFVLP